MQPYLENYRRYFGYGEQDHVPSEISGLPASDIHHIIYRSAGGTDLIDNLIALTRDEHNRVHNHSLTEEYLLHTHRQFMDMYNMFGDMIQ